MNTLTTPKKKLGLSIIRGNDSSPIQELLAISDVRKDIIDELIGCEKGMSTSTAELIGMISKEVTTTNELAYAMFILGQNTPDATVEN